MDIQVLYERRIEAASIALARGDRSETERLYAEALAMGEEHFGATSPQLAVPLNELSRFYVHNSAHAHAEPLLRRLLAIRRVDGESQPAVATVLAALAAVRRGLRDDAAAEDLYRRALAIREVAHAPDHMAVVVTVEQLADTCAARGKFAEAKALLERALPVREKALGAEHATVHGLRARIAEFTLKSAPPKLEAAAPAPAPAHAPAPAPAPAPVVADARPSNQLVFIYEPERPVRRASVKTVKREGPLTPPFSSLAVAAASIIAAPTHVATSQPSAATEVAAPSLAHALLTEVDAPVAPRVNVAPAARDDALRPRQRRVFAPRAEVLLEKPRSRARRYAIAATGMTTMAGALFFANAMSGTPARVPVSVAERPIVAPVPATTLRAGRMALTSAPSKPAAAGEKRVAAPTLPAVLPTIGDIAIPVTDAASADSAIRATTNQRDTYPDQFVSTARLKSPTLTDDRAETQPVLIGSVPQPRYPDGLRSQRIEGAVVVQFLVGADGRVTHRR